MAGAESAELRRAREAKYFLASIVESSGDSIVTVDFDIVITSWNHAAEELYGYSAAEAIGKPLTMLTLPQDLQQVLGNVEKIRQSETVEIFDTVRVNKDGRELHLEIVLSPVKDDDGRVIGVSTIARDITARQEGEASIRFQAQLLDSVEQSVIATDLEGKVIYWNRFAETLFGWSAEEALGQDIMGLTTPNVMAEQGEEIMSQLRQNKGWAGEFLVQRRDGTTFPALVSNSPINDADGKLIGIVGVSIDVTERKQAEIALRESEQHLRLLIESVTDYAILTLDRDLKVTSWNPGAENVFGYSEDEIIGELAEILFTREDRFRQIPEEEAKKATATGRAEDDRWLLRKDGSRFFASGVMVPLRDGELGGFVKIARDQTDKLRADAAVQDSKMLHRLVDAQEVERRRIARDLHDHLGQQLTALRLKLESLKAKYSSDPVFVTDIDETQEQARKIDMDVSFLAWELRPTALDNFGLRDALGKFVQQWSKNHGIAAVYHTVRDRPRRLVLEIETNLYRIAQEALNNILKHAKATNAVVLLEFSKDMVVLSIEDDGSGFDPSSVKQDPTSSHGLGLIGMKERAALIGGTLVIESAPGKGTTVLVRAPARLAEDPKEINE